MRIYSKFKDYYDNVQFYGSDSTVVYVRNTEEIIDPLAHVPPLWNYYALYRFGIESTAFDIFFCGKRYRGYRFYINNKDVYVYTKVQFINKVVNKLSKSDRKSINRTFKNVWQLRDATVLQKMLLGFKSPEDFASFDNLAVHIEYRSPVVCYIDGKVIVNPNLKEYGFASIVHPFTAYQELDMFMSGVLGGNAPVMVEISNEDRIAKHGFNDLSFRHPVKLKDIPK